MEEKRIVVYRKRMFCFDIISSEIYEGSLEHIGRAYGDYKIISITRFTENS